MDEFDVQEAFRQINRGITIKIPRVTQEQIDAHSSSRPRKRQAKKKYHILSFDSSDEEDELYPVCYTPQKRPKRGNRWSAVASSSSSIDEKASNKRKNSRDTSTPTAQLTVEKPSNKRKTSKETQRKNSSDTTRTDIPVLWPKTQYETALNSRLLKPVITTEVKLLKQPEEEAFSYCDLTKVSQPNPCQSKIPLVAKPEPAATPANSKIGKIRIKSAAELGSKIIFLDDDTPLSPSPSTSRVVNSKTASSKNTSTKNFARTGVSKNEQGKNPVINVVLIGDLYAKLFTTANQTKIQTVAEILQSIAENIKNNNERVQEITNNKSLPECEKLRRRRLSFQDLQRKQEENEKKLKETFISLMEIFDNTNFELLFQLFFLGILKILIVSVSYIYKKGTIFKKLINLLNTSLTNAKFEDERLFRVLKSKDFRDKCATLVQFIETHCKTGSFSMLFLFSKNPSPLANEPSTSNQERPVASHKPFLKSETSAVPQRNSFLLQMLKNGKSISNDSVTVAPPANQPAQASFKRYAPTQKQNVNRTTISSTNMAPGPVVNSNGSVNSSRSTTNPGPPANIPGSNGLVNNFVQVKPYSNNVVDIPSSELRPIRPALPNGANQFLHRTPAPSGNPINGAYPVNQKVYQVNGNLNGTHLLSTSNGNIENIKPGSYVNPNNKKVPSHRYLEHYAAGNLNSTSFSTPRNGHNAWTG